MAFSNVLVIAFIFLLGATRLSATNTLAACHFDAIYQFGDSISDTGNSIVETPKANHGRFPYGISMNKATGRSSDGLLMIDYIAQSAGLPLLDPYEKKLQGADFRHGVNFAVAGVTALDAAFLATMNIASQWTNSSLNVQLGWFDTFLDSLCGKDKGNCAQKLKSALFMVGEIGGNDYNYAFSRRDSMSPEGTKKALVPHVVNVIINATKTIIDRGAVRVVVPGIFPLACSPMYLEHFKADHSAVHDRYGCLKAYNDVLVYHNENLQKALTELGKEYPTARIVYGDLYNAFLYVLDNSSRLGFRQLTKACCGGGGKFNVNMQAMCGDKNYTVCANPNEYISWEGIHLTQQTYKYMAEWLIRDIFPKLGCK